MGFEDYTGLQYLFPVRGLQGELQNCTETEDCTVTNPDGVTIVRNCFESVITNDNTNFCGCSDIYGWTGQFCDQASFQLVVLRIFAFLRMGLTVGCLVWAAVLLRRLVNFQVDTVRGGRQDQQKKSRARIVKILVFLALALVCSFTFGIFSFITSYDPTYFELHTFRYFLGDDLILASPKNTVIVDLTSVGVIVFVISASLQISLSWVELIERYDSVFKNMKHTKKIKYYKESVKYVTLFLIIFCSVFVATGYLIPAFAGGIVGSLLLLVLFVVGRHTIVIQIEKSGLNSKDSIKLFNRSTRGHVIVLAVLVFAMLIFAGLDSFRVEPGSLSPSSFALNILLLIILVLIYYDLWYVGEILKNLKKQSKSVRSPRKTSATGFASNDKEPLSSSV